MAEGVIVIKTILGSDGEFKKTSIMWKSEVHVDGQEGSFEL